MVYVMPLDDVSNKKNNDIHILHVNKNRYIYAFALFEFTADDIQNSPTIIQGSSYKYLLNYSLV